MEKVMLDNNAQDKMEDEKPSLFHILKMVKRRETRVIRQIVDMQGNNVCGHRNVLNTFATHLRQKYEPIDIDQHVSPGCKESYHSPVQRSTPNYLNNL